MPVAAGAAGKFTGIRVGVFGFQLAGDHDMIAERAIIVAYPLAPGRAPGEVLRSRQRPADRRAKPVLHRPLREECPKDSLEHFPGRRKRFRMSASQGGDWPASGYSSRMRRSPSSMARKSTDDSWPAVRVSRALS